MCELDSHTCSRLEMTSGVVALRDEYIVIPSALQRLVERYRCAHELFLDLS